MDRDRDQKERGNKLKENRPKLRIEPVFVFCFFFNLAIQIEIMAQRTGRDVSGCNLLGRI